MEQETKQDEGCNYSSASPITKRKDLLSSYDGEEKQQQSPKDVKHVPTVSNSHNENKSVGENRKKFFDGFLIELKVAKTFNAIQTLSLKKRNEIRKFPFVYTPSADNIPEAVIVDETSRRIYPVNDELSDGFLPIKVLGDGNCLCRTGSLYAFGTEDHHIEIRCRIIVEMSTYVEWYLENNDEDPEILTYYQNEVERFSKDGNWAEMYHLMALASVLECEVFSIFPRNLKIEIDRNIYHRKIQPRMSNPSSKPVRVFWTTVGDVSIDSKWYPNHIVACKEHDQISEETNSTYMEDNLLQSFSELGVDCRPKVQYISENTANDPIKRAILTDQVSTDSSFNTCTIDTIQQVIAIQQHNNDNIHFWFEKSPHFIYSIASSLRSLLREGKLHEMRRLYPNFHSHDRNFEDDINDLFKPYVIYGIVSKSKVCGCFKEVVSHRENISNHCDYRTLGENQSPLSIPDELVQKTLPFLEKKMKEYLLPFYHQGRPWNELCIKCYSRCQWNLEILPGKENVQPAPMFIIMLPADGACASGQTVSENILQSISSIRVANYEYALGACILLINQESDSEYDSNDDDNVSEDGVRRVEESGHYIAHIYIFVKNKGMIEYQRFCNSTGLKSITKFVEEGNCSTFLFFRTDQPRH